MIFGNAALGHSSVKFKPRRRHFDSSAPEKPGPASCEVEPAAVEQGAVPSRQGPSAPLPCPAPDDVERGRSARLAELLWAGEAVGPAGAPFGGRIAKAGEE
mmetsp:Transcript_69153/g.218530  ORF Transcript_69153/g.218530 Transcript_69153/m.218530 type:complete len:101 (+) Transcript_69153:3-305(+)